MAGGHDFNENEKVLNKKTGRKLQFDAKELVGFDKPKSSVTIVTRQAIAREIKPREIKNNRGEMLGTLEIRMGEDLAQTQRSLSHLIRDGDFHEKRMAKTKLSRTIDIKKSSQREIRPIWNNVQR
ncbi:hypothetical protein Tco_0686816 [Tanacetum coccineum]